MVKTTPIPVTKMHAAALRVGLYWAIGCLVAIYLWTPTALGGNIANLNLLVILGLVFYHGLAMVGNPIASEIGFLRSRTLSCSSKAVRT
jgi:hypothetical protein